LTKKNPGKEFEEDLKISATEQNIFFYRIKDVNPLFLKPNTKVSQNDFDSFVYKYPNLFPIEFKSSGQKSISFDETSLFENNRISVINLNKQKKKENLQLSN
jgi:hypothetical protein